MDRTALVAADFETGSKMVEIFDQSGLQLSVAIWLRLPEYDDWRFLVSSRRLDSLGLAEAYGLVHDALKQAGLPLELTPPIFIMKMTDPLIKTLRRLFGRARSVAGMRLGGQMIGDRFVEDAIVYRIK